MTGTGTSGELLLAPLSRAEGYEVVPYTRFLCLQLFIVSRSQFSNETVHGFAPEEFCC